MAVSESHVTESGFLETRAAQLAAVSLTRHRGVAVEIDPGRGGRHLDLLVSLSEAGQDDDHLLGIEVEAVRPAMRPQDRQRALREASRLHPLSLAPVPLPICLFVFTMDDDQGYWRWLCRPGAKGELTRNEDFSLAPLTDEAVRGILGAVRDWYR